MRDEWLNFMPVFIIFFFVCYPYEFVQISETALGKLFAVFLILYYSSVDLVYGICVCAIIVFYYHVEVSTSIWSIERSQQMHESMVSMMQDLDSTNAGCGCSKSACGCTKCKQPTAPDSSVESFQSGDAAPFKYEPFDMTIGNNYNEAVLSGVSRKKELEHSFSQPREPMYSSIGNNSSSQQFVSDESPRILPTQVSATNSVASRIFESLFQ